MKRTFFYTAVLLLVSLLSGCKAFRTLTGARLKNSQGAPYELIVVCNQPMWNGELGDTLRSVIQAPIPYLVEHEPLFNVIQFTPANFKGMIAEHRNILKIEVSDQIPTATASVQYDVTAAPQIVLTLQGPDQQALVRYVSDHRAELLRTLEAAERDRSIRFAEKFEQKELSRIVREKFGIEMNIPKGYTLAQQSDDFLWFRYEFPTASQGFMLYSYPYEGRESLSPEALLAARNRFAARIPGPSDGSYMTTSRVFTPVHRMFRLEGRAWAELRGFWDVEGDFMGGPFVSYSTVDAATGRILTLDCYVYSPKNPKRNYMREVEHLLHLIRFPEAGQTPAARQAAAPDAGSPAAR